MNVSNLLFLVLEDNLFLRKFLKTILDICVCIYICLCNYFFVYLFNECKQFTLKTILDIYIYVYVTSSLYIFSIKIQARYALTGQLLKWLDPVAAVIPPTEGELYEAGCNVLSYFAYVVRRVYEIN